MLAAEFGLLGFEGFISRKAKCGLTPKAAEAGVLVMANSLSAPDLHATAQRTQMAAAIKSWITSLEFGEKFYSGLIRILFQPLKHLSPVSCAALGGQGHVREACC